MTNLNTQMRTIAQENSNLVRVMELTNGAAVNGFKKDENKKLSDNTFNNIGSKTGHKMIQVMVDQNNSDIINLIEEYNNSFISKVQEILAADKKVKEDKKLEKDAAAKLLKEKKEVEIDKLENIGNNNIDNSIEESVEIELDL